MATSIMVSFQTAANPRPLIITSFTMMKDHFEGTILEMICNGTGIFSIGNIKPLKSSVGRNRLIMEVNIAVCCVFAEFDMSIPTESEVIVKRILSAINSIRLPLMGTLSA